VHSFNWKTGTCGLKELSLSVSSRELCLHEIFVIKSRHESVAETFGYDVWLMGCCLCQSCSAGKEFVREI
jgi:hypothetical protein